MQKDAESTENDGKGGQRVKARLILLRNSFTSAASPKLPPRAVLKDGLQDLWPCCRAELLLPRHRPRHEDGDEAKDKQNPMDPHGSTSGFLNCKNCGPTAAKPLTLSTQTYPYCPILPVHACTKAVLAE